MANKYEGFADALYGVLLNMANVTGADTEFWAMFRDVGKKWALGNAKDAVEDLEKLSARILKTGRFYYEGRSGKICAPRIFEEVT